MSKIIHIISIVASLLTIIVSILVYFGIIRFIKLYMSKSTEKYIEKYTDLPFVSKKRVVVVLSVQNETQLKNIVPTINSLLDQTVRVNQFFLVLPCNTEYDIPENLKKILTVITPGKIYDEQYQDIITILQREKEKEIFIIKVSNNIIYGNEFIENVIEIAESNPDSVIKDNSNSFLIIKPDLVILDDNSNFSGFVDNVKNISYKENYRY